MLAKLGVRQSFKDLYPQKMIFKNTQDICKYKVGESHENLKSKEILFQLRR